MTKPIKYTPAFSAFWAQCLKHWRRGRVGGKQAAMRAWKDHSLEGRVDEVIKSMRAMACFEYRNTESVYWPHISKWINAGYYDNPLPDPKKRQAKSQEAQQRRREAAEREKVANFNERRQIMKWAEKFTDETLERMHRKICAEHGIPVGSNIRVRDKPAKLALVHKYYTEGGEV